MTVGIATDIADAILDALCSNSAWSQPAEFWVKLHIGSPGVDGTSNPAAETTRQQATFAASAAGVCNTNADLDWVNVSDTERYTHVSFWDDETAGTFVGSDALDTPRSVTAGDNFSILAGDASVTLGPLAA